jgi:hypothetical protein
VSRVTREKKPATKECQYLPRARHKSIDDQRPTKQSRSVGPAPAEEKKNQERSSSSAGTVPNAVLPPQRRTCGLRGFNARARPSRPSFVNRPSRFASRYFVS